MKTTTLKNAALFISICLLSAILLALGTMVFQTISDVYQEEAYKMTSDSFIGLIK